MTFGHNSWRCILPNGKNFPTFEVHIFLVGLDGDFEQVQGEILRKDPLPHLEECYALIQRETVRHASMKAESDNLDTLAMDHNRDQQKKGSKKTLTAVVAKIKTKANVTEKASALVAAIDYGDHVTFDSRQVSLLRPSSQKIVSTTNGNTTLVIGEGSLTLTDTLNLDSVLVDPFMKRLPHRHNKATPNSVQKALADPRMHGVRKAMSEGVQVEEVIVWVEAIPDSMVWKETRKSGCQPVDTLIEEDLKLCVEPNQVSTDKGRYQRLLGRLMYLAHTRLDLAYALSVNAPGKGILFTKNVDHQSLEVYTNVDWAGGVDDRRSTSGYFTFVSGNLVTWKSKSKMSSLVQVQKRNLGYDSWTL
ncbi:hypothetical protein CK203_107017 [Vitis vinifera]|uniref:Mitochondrial protein n=1 Tax=Vitis vinifera TaxID=29760 RepID=A0A438ERX2_VITVI|nr:hypothetical protein CK203_107017 [Vitis vinifera]